ILRSVRLDAINVALAELVVPIPAGALQRRNEVALGVAQYAAAASDPVSTTIAARSFLQVAYQEQSSSADLREFPLPLFDPEIPRARRVALLIPPSLSAPPPGAPAPAAANLALRTGGQALEVHFVHSLREAGEPAVVVGTAAEQPSLRTLPSPPAPSRSTVGLAEAREGGAPLLYVTADTPEGVLQAAWGLVAE